MLWWILDPRRVELFQNVGERAQIPVEALKVPDVVLCDYSLRPIPIGACVELELEWQGRSVTTTVHLRSDVGDRGEPCLLGTNVVIPLGLMVPDSGVEPRGGTGDVSSKDSSGSVVRLVLAKRASGGSAAVVMAPRCSGSGPIVLQPWMEDAGLRCEDLGVSADAEGYMHLLVESSSRPPKLIDVGAVVGHAGHIGRLVGPEEFNGGAERPAELGATVLAAEIPRGIG